MTHAYITTENPSGQLDAKYAHASLVTLHRVRSGGRTGYSRDVRPTVHCPLSFLGCSAENRKSSSASREKHSVTVISIGIFFCDEPTHRRRPERRRAKA